MAIEISTLTGKVEKQLIHKDSKNEREAVVLVTEAKLYVLRQHGGHAMKDPELEDLVGKKIKGEGKINSHVFVMSEWEEID